MSKPVVTENDLSFQEQAHVQNALYFMRAKLGTWKSLAAVLRFEEITVVQSANGTRTVSASMAFRLARFIKIPVDDLTLGKFPVPGLCPRCGYTLPMDGKFKNAKSAR